MHPGGRSYPDPTHKLEQAAKFTHSCCVGDVCKRALDAIHRPKSFVSGQKEHSRSGDEDHSQRTDAPACRFSGIAVVRPTARVRDLVPRAQERNNVISAHRRKDDVIRIHEGDVHARTVLAKVLPASL
eukprot:5062317-Pleurochrysis_carterae.AAC.1